MELRDPPLSSLFGLTCTVTGHSDVDAGEKAHLLRRLMALNLRLTEILAAIGYCCASCNLTDVTSVSISRLGRFEYLERRGVGCRDEKMVENRASFATYSSLITKMVNAIVVKFTEL